MATMATRLERTRRTLALGLLPLLVVACPKNDAARGEADGGRGADADVESVYPIEADAPAVPLAEKLCAALSELPENKRAACCSTTPGVVLTAECTRALSAALRHKAVEIAENDVTVCIAAFEQTLAGCDWVGPFPPGPPPACLGIVKGRIAAGQKCRSSLECAGSLRCLGVGPTTTGSCGAPKSTGELCGGTVDTLAGYTRQSDVDKRHPECKERCIKRKCAPPVAEGGACQTTADCGDGLQCILVTSTAAPKLGFPQKKCVAKALPKEGEPCPGGVCEGDLRCIRNRCAARKAAGEECTADFECRGGCLEGDAGERGKCGPRCDQR